MVRVWRYEGTNESRMRCDVSELYLVMTMTKTVGASWLCCCLGGCDSRRLLLTTNHVSCGMMTGCPRSRKAVNRLVDRCEPDAEAVAATFRQCARSQVQSSMLRCTVSDIQTGYKVGLGTKCTQSPYILLQTSRSVHFSVVPERPEQVARCWPSLAHSNVYIAFPHYVSIQAIPLHDS